MKTGYEMLYTVDFGDEATVSGGGANTGSNQITLYSGFNESEVALILRSFFVERYPHLEEEFNEKFVTEETYNYIFENLFQENGFYTIQRLKA